MQKYFEDDDLYMILGMLHYMSMTQIQREFGYTGGGNSAIKGFLKRHGIDHEGQILSRSRFMKRKARQEAPIIQEPLPARLILETYIDDLGRTIKRYAAGYAYGSKPQTLSGVFLLVDI